MLRGYTDNNGTKPGTPPLHYLLVIEDTVEPDLRGPFTKVKNRDAAAIQHRRNDPEKNDGLFKLEIINGMPHVSTYSGGDLDGTINDESEDDV
jgi:hypothetical protein